MKTLFAALALTLAIAAAAAGPASAVYVSPEANFAGKALAGSGY